MGTMSGSAARRATAAPPDQWEPPLELHARSWTDEHARSVLHARKWRTQGGLARQSAYAVIDMLLVCGSALLIYGLRFGFSNSWNAVVAPRQVIGHISLQAYPAFLILYCSLIFLGCISQGLYRTPRELSALVESIRVSKAVGIATALLVLFIFTSGNKEISRLVVVLTGAVNVFTLSGWRYAKRRLVLHRAEKGQGQSRALVIGAGKMGQAFASWLQHNRHLGYDFCGFLDPHPNGDKRVLGDLGEFRRVALASTKQSRRAVVPEIRTPLTLDVFLDDPPGALRLMLVEPGAAASPEHIESLSALQRRPAPADAVVLVGPEGGWTEEEWSAASARGVRLLTLGHRTLRADAVPIAAISVLQFVWGDL